MGGSRSPGETRPGCGPFEARFAEQAPEDSKEPTDLTLAGEGHPVECGRLNRLA